MKKQLIGTTALVGVGALVASGAVQAADPLSLTIGGTLQTVLEYDDDDDSATEPGENRQDFNIYNAGEIQFTASTTLDNGIGVKVRIEYEAQNQGTGATNHDERWVEFSGGFGQLRIGSDDNASNAMHYQAPVAVGVIGVNTPSWAVALAGGNSVGSYPRTYINTAGDAEKVIWFSPRVGGFQLGLSYAPDGDTQDTSGTGSYQPQFDNDAGQQEDIFSVGVNFVESFNDIDVAVSGGYLTGNLEADTALANADDVESWSAGLSIGFAGFTIGASVALTNNGLDDDGDTTTWDAGVTYATGPLTVGFTYLHAEFEDPATLGDDETDQGAFSANYNIGPGVDLWGGIKIFELEDDTNVAADENEGYIVTVGTTVSF